MKQPGAEETDTGKASPDNTSESAATPGDYSPVRTEVCSAKKLVERSPLSTPDYYSITPAAIQKPNPVRRALLESWGRSGRDEYDNPYGYALLCFYHFAH